jgi:hypothetical protein
MANGEVGAGKLTSLMDYCDTFREHRRMFHRFLEGKKAYQFRPHIESEIWKFIENLQNRPEELCEHIKASVHLFEVRLVAEIDVGMYRRTTASIILLISHGYPVDPIAPYNDPFVRYGIYDCRSVYLTTGQQPCRGVGRSGSEQRYSREMDGRSCPSLYVCDDFIR